MNTDPTHNTPKASDFITGPVDPEREGRELATIAMEYVELEMRRSWALDDIEAEVQRARRDPNEPWMQAVVEIILDFAGCVTAQQDHSLVGLHELVQAGMEDHRMQGTVEAALRTLAEMKAETRGLLLNETTSDSPCAKTVVQLERRFDLVEQSEWALQAGCQQHRA